jgi:titin
VRITGRNANFNQVVGNIVGLQADGTVDPTYTRVIGSPCVDVNGGASRNRIGMPGNENRNVISGCYEKAIAFYNQFTWKNYVQNNIIGLDPTGTKRRRSDFGIDVNWSANGTIIGGLATQERNVISGNINAGVEISHGTGTINNSVVGNYIGTDVTGTRSSAETGNNDIGVRLEGVPDCGTKPCASDAGRETVTDNVIVNSGWGGILVDKGVHDSTIARNRIGVTLDGTVVGNASFGVRLSSGATNITVGPANTIAGSAAGVQITPFSVQPAGTTSTVTAFNRITQNSISDTSGYGIDLRPFNTINTGATADL